jgi:hypothetical protein
VFGWRLTARGIAVILLVGLVAVFGRLGYPRQWSPLVDLLVFGRRGRNLLIDDLDIPRGIQDGVTGAL